MGEKDREFETAVIVHLDAAYNLARWLVKDSAGADDVVQESCLRALRYFGGFRGGDARPWLLGIVRNTAYTWLRQRGSVAFAENAPDDDPHDGDIEATAWQEPVHNGPEAALIRKTEVAQIDAAIAALPLAYREVMVLRALEDLSYEAIARVVGVPIGTVMSRLSRARAMLRETLANHNGGL